MVTYDEKEFKKVLAKLESILQNFNQKYKVAKGMVENLKAEFAEKTIPPLSLPLDINLSYGPYTDKPTEIKVDNVSLAIIAIGEILEDFGNSSSGVGFEKIDLIYKSLPIGYQLQLKPLYEALQHEVNMKRAKMEQEKHAH